MRRVGLISCVKSKASAPTTARDLYVSPYYRKMRAYVEVSCDDWRILSALHGLLRPDTIGEPYEVTLKTMGRPERREWANRVTKQIQKDFPRPSEIVFEVHAGREYSQDLVPRLKAAGYTVEIPVPELAFGLRLQWYDRNPPGTATTSRQPRPVAARHESRAIRAEPPAPSPLSSVKATFDETLDALLHEAQARGARHVDVNAGELHRRVGGYPAPAHMPSGCAAMRRQMRTGDLVIEAPPKGNGPRLTIRYVLPRSSRMDGTTACDSLHRIAGALPEFRYPFDKDALPKDGIYFFYETGEKWGHAPPEAPRIVRVGTHREGNFRSRMADHYLLGRRSAVRVDRPAPKDRSVFRKNLGRALLNRANDPYLGTWEIDFTTSANRRERAGLRDLEVEQRVEDAVSRLLHERFTFRCLPMTGEAERMGAGGLEARLIGTLARCPLCRPSGDWLGNHSPKPEIRRSGLWLSQHLNAPSLDEDGFRALRLLASP